MSDLARLRRLADAGDPDALEALLREEARRGGVVRRRTEVSALETHGYGYNSGNGYGYGYSEGYGEGYGEGEGYGYGDGDGYGTGYDYGYGDGYGTGYGTGDGDGRSRTFSLEAS